MQLENHEGRITELENAFDDSWYVRAGLRGAWVTADVRGVFDEQDSDGFGGFSHEKSILPAGSKFITLKN